MKAVAYCRVSTNKDEQLESLEAQQKFFTEYAARNELNLIKIYADEGKSGTKMKNRTELLKLLADANRSAFETVLIKDVSRLARNTVDFLTSIRKLKALGVKVVFVNYDQTSSDSSEFMLTMLSAIAQEESANTSKRVKFGKKLNAEKGRVPNLIYGYDKTPGDYFNLSINEAEAETVRRIFDIYVNQETGSNRIALVLNREGLKTKRGCEWTQNAVSRILTNQIYIGKIVNGKAEVEDFLTGKRKIRDSKDWLVIKRPDLSIIDTSTFEKAAQILAEHQNNFKATGERKSDKHLFSKLIKCKCCGASFRRSVRTYQNTYVKWVCSERNLKGADACPNSSVIDEAVLFESVRIYFSKLLKDKQGAIEHIIAEFNRVYKQRDENQLTEKELAATLNKLRRTKEKYMEMYSADVITLAELREKTTELNVSMDKLEEELKLVRSHITKGDLLGGILNETFKDIDSLLSSSFVTNAMLSKVINKIEVGESGSIDIYLRNLSDIGLDSAVHITDVRT